NKPEFKDKGSCENVPRRELQHRHPALKVETRRDGSSERRLRRKVLLLIPAETQHPDDNQPQVLVMLSESCASVIPSDISPAPGPLPALLGRRGPGRQSSMAVYRQILQEHADTSETQTGNSRGTIPLELREWQGGKAVGTLIMGPDGEIIRLSLWDPSVDAEDNLTIPEVPQGHVLKVVTTEGDLKQPWTFFIQDQDTDEEDIPEVSEEKEQLDSSHEGNRFHQDTSKEEKEEEEEDEEEDKSCLGSDDKPFNRANMSIMTPHTQERVTEEEDAGFKSQIIQEN
ncbi:hypothetical protein DNTS_000102, partial [Danionella cerebrum]